MLKEIEEKTDLFTLETKQIIEISDYKAYKRKARKISRETNVPLDLIYYHPFRNRVDNWFKLNKEWYYFKEYKTNSSFFNELLGELVSKYFNIDTVEYKITKVITPTKIKYGISSKNFVGKKDNCLTCLDFEFSKKIDDLMSLKNLEILREYTKNDINYKELLKTMKTFLIRDLYASQKDRAYTNFLFKENKGSLYLAPLFDYEDSFGTAEIYYRNQIVLLSLFSEETKKVLNDSTFQIQLNKLMLLDMKRLIEELEDRHKILMTDDYKNYYNNYDRQIKKKILDSNVIE